MADQLPGWAEATIERMNRNPERAKALFSLADWPSIGDGFEVEAGDDCPKCGHPTIDVVEPSEGETPLSLVTSGCLVCDVFRAVDPEEVDLVDWDEIPGDGDLGSADEGQSDAH